MSVYKPSELQQFLAGLGISPKKALSQNFLIDKNIINKILKAAQVNSEDVILEIGSGPGSLTEQLLLTGATVIAVEKDHILAEALKRFQTAEKELHILNEDIMTVPVEEIVKKHIDKKKGSEKAKVVANLPYHVTTPILTTLVSKYSFFSHLVIMVQEEVARRITASPGNFEYGSLTVFLNAYANPKYSFFVSRNCFYPVPGVDSAIVTLELKPPPHIENLDDFFKMVRLAFSHRRKMLRASLRELYPLEKINTELPLIGISPEIRPEMISLEQWVLIFLKLNKLP